MKRIIMFGLAIIALALGTKLLITPAEVELYEHVEPPIEPIELSAPPEGLHPLEEAIYRTQVSEELIRKIHPKLRKLATLLETGDDSASSATLFIDTIQFTGIKPGQTFAPANPQSLFKPQQWTVLNASSESPASAIFSALPDDRKFSQTKFGVLSGDLLEGDDEFEMMTSFEGQVHLGDSDCSGFSSKQRIIWKKENESWRISQWHQLDFKTIRSQTPFFDDVTIEAIPNKTTQHRIKRSTHMEMMVQAASGEAFPQQDDTMFKLFNDWHSAAVFPSVSVVDFDDDGHEDLFLSGEWTSPLMLRNRGDGTFEDVTTAVGLKLDEARVNCAIFADFDNDGDSDAFLGRSTLPSLFYRNVGGKFVVDKEANSELEQCSFVSAASAIDINNDGLLDLYVSTYVSYGSTNTSWIQHAVEPAKRQKLRDKVWGRHSYVDKGGPPNLLFVNDRGTLRQIKIDDDVEQWRNSFQPVWIDFDEDGDSDLYVCNDFSPDVLLRNDTARGTSKIKFVDVTAEAFSNISMAFGMGASVGDFDSDGALDLYVSNMYSKAGKRVFKHLESTGVSPELQVAAAGNFLFRKNDSGFTQVAGLNKDDQQVAKVGWSFGGQFADFDNDGSLDLYVPSGLFTAPEEIERMDDL